MKNIEEVARKWATSDGEGWFNGFLREVKGDVQTIVTGLEPKIAGNIHGETWWALTLEAEDGSIIDSVGLGKCMGDKPSISRAEAVAISSEGVAMYTLPKEAVELLRLEVARFVDLDINGFGYSHEIGGWVAMDPRADSGVPEWDARAKELFRERADRQAKADEEFRAWKEQRDRVKSRAQLGCSH